MSLYSKIGIARPPFPKSHPFKIDIGKEPTSPGSLPKYTLSVNYHSGLYRGFRIDDDLERINITGLDFPKTVPTSFPGKNFYCVLKIIFENSTVSSAKIEWVEGDESEDDLIPLKFTGTGLDKKQSEARIIIGVLVSDDEVIAGLPSNESAVNTPYILQFVNTNLVLMDMCVNGNSVKYPLPMSGGRLNF